MNKQRKLINKIREEYSNMAGMPKDSLNNSIKILADDLYAKDSHFIFELIQNAEDNLYADGVRAKLKLSLIKCEQRGFCLFLENNELGFEEKNVKAIWSRTCTLGILFKPINFTKLALAFLVIKKLIK